MNRVLVLNQITGYNNSKVFSESILNNMISKFKEEIIAFYGILDEISNSVNIETSNILTPIMNNSCITFMVRHENVNIIADILDRYDCVIFRGRIKFSLATSIIDDVIEITLCKE